ncbi:helix-turn-helix transcriptional regulator [Rhizobium sp. G21]|uniref:helix-turn-helix transcriptional regulator n=1 Tax=Rhizobium sp. G21 TaxID=2758439 RepID=UPI0016031811|nr:AraC family transcriptional regulator [Rhizobium sp. G21]MBB1249915.1 helix-turn-helix transcriptional regulator [Rhizobium sp. G21]
MALVELGHCLVRHAHPHCHMLFKVGGANSHFFVDDAPAPLTDESVVLVDAWRPHEFVFRPGQPPTQILALYIESDWLAALNIGCADFNPLDFFKASSGHVSRETYHLLMAAVDCLNGGAPSRSEMEVLLAQLVLSTIRRSHSAGESASRFGRPQLFDWRIRKAVKLFQQNNGDFDKIDAIVSEIGMSRANFFRQFKACTGMSPGLFQNVVRLEQAIRLTVVSQDSLSATASSLGFSDPAHFSRFFRNHTAVSPRLYRQGASEWLSR